jgi:CheY-like chemotaxis protein
MKQTSQTILLVEDYEDDVFAMERALLQANITNSLQVVTDGQQALDYLSGTGQYSNRTQYPLPFIVFLDLKLPFVDGFEVLTWVRQQPALESLVVIILTGSAESRDQDKAYALGARSYLVKPPTAETLNGIFDSLKSFWLSKTNEAPILGSGQGRPTR